MKQYKLKRVYPNLPKGWKVGMELGTGDRYYDYSPCDGRYIDSHLSIQEVENFPEFWEEIFSDIPQYVKCINNFPRQFTEGKIYKTKIVNNGVNGFIYIESDDKYSTNNGAHKHNFVPATKEEYDKQFVKKEYEILYFKVSDNSFASQVMDKDGKFNGKYGSPHVSLEEALTKWSIQCIRRNSDGKIFQTEEKVMLYYPDPITIKEFKIDNNISDGLSVGFDEIKAFVPINRIKKFTKIPLFYTEDNIPIYEGDEYWFLDDRYSTHVFSTKLSKEQILNPDVKRFSNKQAAEDYVNSKKVIFTTKDGIDIHKGDDYYFVDKNYLKVNNVIHSKVFPNDGSGMCTDDFFYFSSQQAANDYIEKNKILCITEDGIGLKEGDIYYAAPKKCNIQITVTSSILSKSCNQEVARHNGWLWFSTLELAQSYIDMNKEIYSLKDVEQMFIESGYQAPYYKHNLEILKNLKK